jgi:hypothetical protein
MAATADSAVAAALTALVCRVSALFNVYAAGPSGVVPGLLRAISLRVGRQIVGTAPPSRRRRNRGRVEGRSVSRKVNALRVLCLLIARRVPSQPLQFTIGS